MADGSINFDVRLNTDSFKNDLSDMMSYSKDALETLDEAIKNGAVAGIESLQEVSQSAFAQLMEFSEEEKNFLIQNSKSAIQTEEEREKEISKLRRKAAAKKLAKITDEERLQNEVRERELKQLRNSLELGVIAQSEYYVKLKEYRDKYFAVGSEEWEEYTVEILKYCKDTAEQIAKAQKKAILNVFEEMTEKTEESYQNVINLQKKMEDKLKNYGGLYTEKSFTSAKTGNTYSWLALGDMGKDINILKNYNNALVDTKELLYSIFPTTGDGLSKDIIEENKQYIKDFFGLLADMSVEEGLTFTAYLNRLSEKEKSAYLISWAEKQNVAKEISKNLYSDDVKEVYQNNIENMAKDMIETLEQSFGDLPDNFFDNGVAAAMGFGEGFIQSIEDVFNEIRSKIEYNLKALMPNFDALSLDSGNVIQNSTSYNIYANESAKSTALEIYKQDTLKQMLVGEY